MNKTTQTIAINSLTDPGFMFGLGNAAVTSGQGIEASGANVVAALICLGARLTSEMRNAGYHVSLPSRVDDIIKNPGSGMMAGGVLGLVSAGFAAGNIDVSQPETALPTAIITFFAVNGLSLGAAAQFDSSSTKRKILEGVGCVATTAGLLLSAQDAPLPVKVAFSASGLMGAYMAIFNKKAEGVLQPYLTNAAGATLSAIRSPSTEFAIANTLWVGGYLGVNSLLKHGGVTQAIHKAKARLWGAPQHNI